MENMNIRQAMLFLAKEFGFEHGINNTQDLVELAMAMIQQGQLEFTEDKAMRIYVKAELENGVDIHQKYWSEYLENEKEE